MKTTFLLRCYPLQTVMAQSMNAIVFFPNFTSGCVKLTKCFTKYNIVKNPLFLICVLRVSTGQAQTVQSGHKGKWQCIFSLSNCRYWKSFSFIRNNANRVVFTPCFLVDIDLMSFREGDLGFDGRLDWVASPEVNRRLVPIRLSTHRKRNQCSL